MICFKQLSLDSDFTFMYSKTASNFKYIYKGKYCLKNGTDYISLSCTYMLPRLYGPQSITYPVQCID